MKQYLILTLFPSIVPGPLGIGVIGRAIEKGLLSIDGLNIRDYSESKHNIVDDTTYGGGGGMIMKPGPLVRSIEAAKEKLPSGSPVVLMSPQGSTLTQKKVHEFADAPGLIAVCGRYEGMDERVRRHIDHEISVGDYVLSGGEIPAMILLDSIARQIPGVLGNPDCLLEESFQRPLLEYPQYTRPSVFQDIAVPDVLLSGNHEKIRKWRFKQAVIRTMERRPELLELAEWDKEEQKLIREAKAEQKKKGQ